VQYSNCMYSVPSFALSQSASGYAARTSSSALPPHALAG
jgi:hypothetical protein